METGAEEVKSFCKVVQLAVMEPQSHPPAPVPAAADLPVRPLNIFTSSSVSYFITGIVEIPTEYILLYLIRSSTVLASEEALNKCSMNEQIECMLSEKA